MDNIEKIMLEIQEKPVNDLKLPDLFEELLDVRDRHSFSQNPEERKNLNLRYDQIRGTLIEWGEIVKECKEILKEYKRQHRGY